MISLEEAVKKLKETFPGTYPSRYVEYGDDYIFIVTGKSKLMPVMDPWRRVNKKTGECSGFPIFAHKDVAKLMQTKGVYVKDVL